MKTSPFNFTHMKHILSEINPTEKIPGFYGRFVHMEGFTLAYWEVKEGAILPEHSHENEQITQVIRGRMRFRMGENGEQEIELGPGDVVVIPAFVPHEALAIGDVEEMDLWAPRRQDWLDGSDDYLRQRD